MKARIAEVFESIQGEGIYLGERQVFVRFFGCNLSCAYCDTKPGYFTQYSPQELLEELSLYRGKYHSISFTGGEPLLQRDFLLEVLKETAKRGYRNYLETNGTLFSELEDLIDYIDIIAMDIKLASSSGMGDLLWMHRRFLQIAAKKEVFLKIVICAGTEETDLHAALEMVKETNPGSVLVLQPNSYDEQQGLNKKISRFKDICNNSNIVSCIIPQIHKIAGVR